LQRNIPIDNESKPLTEQSSILQDTQGALRKSALVTRSPVFYGWIILVAAGIGRILTSPGQTYTVSIFIDHFMRDLDLSRSLVSALYLVGTLSGSLALPFVGQQIDRHGPRLMVGVVTALLALACVYMSFVQGAVMLAIGFVLIRMLGQGSLGLVCTNAVNRWWVRRRGTVLGLLGMVVTVLGTGTFPSLANALIVRFGWRTSYSLMGLLVAVVMLPVGLIFFRRQPEDYGLLPDGQAPDGQVTDGRLPNRQEAETKVAAGTPSAEQEVHWTRREAVRTPVFWILAAGGVAMSALGTGLHFHMVSIFDDAGMSAATAAAAFMPLAITGAVVTVVSGVLIDRVPVRYLFSAALLAQTASLIMAPRLQGTTSALLYGIILGATGSLQNTVNGVVWARYYGRRHLGSVSGLAMSIVIAGSALGPLPMGMARDLMGSYRPMLTASALLPLILAVVALWARRPTRGTKPAAVRGVDRSGAPASPTTQSRAKNCSN
jgi:MFS family permease